MADEHAPNAWLRDEQQRDDEPAFTAADFDPTSLDTFIEVDVCEARLILTGPGGEAYELACDVDGPHDEHEALVRWKDVATKPVTCLVPLQLHGGVFEPCTLRGAHTIHVSEHGYYRWDDAGTLLPTPHFADPEFARLYEQDPRGQFEWKPEGR